MAIPSVMQHSFSQVPRAEIPRSSFDRTSGHKTAFDAGYLVPIFIDEALPGDTFNLNMTGFCRLATPLRPFMDNVMFNTFFFAVPMRLVWDNWQRFMGEQDNPGDSTDYLLPHNFSNATTGYAINSIYDYMGLPTGIPNVGHSILPFRAYNLIWNSWFRDQNLQDSEPVNKGDTDTVAIDGYKLLRRGKRHDYFTSCLPWPQKGPSVSIPIAENIPVMPVNPAVPPQFMSYPPGPQPAVPLAVATDGHVVYGAGTAGELYWATGGPTGLEVAGTALATTINELRQAFQLQKLHERDARGGTRYTEIVRAHFNVISPDARLQRPEYLGGGQGYVNLYQVTQNSGTPEAAGTPQGNLAAYGTASLSGHGFTQSFTEHCIILGLVSVRADLNYQQGLNRMWKRRSKYDFYWPALSMIGEQAVLNGEIYSQGYQAINPATNVAYDDEVWGYQERFAEYRYKPSIITGEMRSSAPQSLDTWHLAQDFATLPKLDAAFMEDNPPISRVIAVQTERHFIADFYFKLRCARPMPVYGVPGLIDHF